MIMQVEYESGAKEFKVRVAPEDVPKINRFGRMQTTVGERKVSVYPTDDESYGEVYGNALAFHLKLRSMQRDTSVTFYFQEGQMKKVE